MANSDLPLLNVCHKQDHKLFVIINRCHALIHFIALAFLVYYRVSFLCQLGAPKSNRIIPILPWLLIFGSELLLSFIWFLGQAYRWRPVSRAVFPENLPQDDKLPTIDVFICTADPNKEPTVEVMSTVLSAMALDYPPEKLHVYLSDDGGAAVTLLGMREAWRFARIWLPFCRRHGIKTRCPKAYFSGASNEYDPCWVTAEFIDEREKIKEKYEKFKKQIINSMVGKTNTRNSRDHPPVVQVIQDKAAMQEDDQVQLPQLVYVSREKRPSHPHHFKAGALNVLLRVSGIISNSPYILILDCDMYCNDPSSARQAMCFHLDQNMSPSLASVQFPQMFYNISENDIYDAKIRFIFKLYWYGIDGLNGPCLSGSNFYIKRNSLYDSTIRNDDSNGRNNQLVKSRHSDDLIKSSGTLNGGDSSSSTLMQEAKLLASCTYEDSTKWGAEIGFRYEGVAEDYHTGFHLHCKGWKSVYINPSRPQFLGTATTNLNDLLVQGIRWSSGLVEAGISRFCPLLYGPLRMSFLQSMCYAELVFQPLFHCLSLCCFATIPQLCLLNGIPLYPEVSDPFFYVFLFVFISAISKHLYEVLITGGSIWTMINEQRIWMIKSVTCNVYGSFDAVMKRVGRREVSFVPTNKVADDEQLKRYQMGIFDFQTSIFFTAPLVTIAILNIEAFLVGVIRTLLAGNLDGMFAQLFLSFYISVINYAIIEGMLIRKDKGSIPSSITLLSTVFSLILWFLGSFFLMY